VAERLRLGDRGAGLADDDAQLALEHHLAVAQWLADARAGRKVGVGRLQQVERLRGHRQLELLAERMEVVPQRNDLGRLGRREEPHAREQEHAACRLRALEHVAAVLVHGIAFERAEARFAAVFETDPPLLLLLLHVAFP
jgi:hypothetical protein